MNLSRLASLRQTGAQCATVARIVLLCLVLFLGGTTRLQAQEAPDQVLVDKQTLQTLLQRVDEL